jgi:hypothetical protein
MTSKGRARCCQRPECRALVAEIDTIIMLQFILTNMRWAGGEGLETPEELVALAIKQLPIDEGPLAELLIEIIEETAPA